MARPQLEMVVEDPTQAARDREKDHKAQNDAFQDLLAACRDVCLTIGYDKAANALDAIWSKHGRPVSASFLTATLDPKQATRSYFRLEWVIWFAQQSAEVSDILVTIGIDSPKDPTEELDDIYNVIREDVGGKLGEALIRKAKARRRRRR